jgi:acetyl esterase/lipase
MAVVKGVFKVLDERKIAYSSQDLTIMGDSAGGAICASMCMNQAFVAATNIKKQVLIYPSVDYTLTSPSLETLGVGYLLEKAKIKWYFNSCFQHNEDRKAVSPVYGDFYQDMPQTLVVVAAYDPLIDEGIEYYKKVQNAGVEAELLQVEGVVHAYLMLENLCPEECAETYQAINNFLIKT